jgi:hypothetical protein
MLCQISYVFMFLCFGECSITNFNFVSNGVNQSNHVLMIYKGTPYMATILNNCVKVGKHKSSGIGFELKKMQLEYRHWSILKNTKIQIHNDTKTYVNLT